MLLISNNWLAPTKDAFAILMACGSQPIVLQKIAEENGRDAMLVEYFEHKETEFIENEKKIFDNVMNTLIAVVWYLDGQEVKFKETTGCKVPPQVFFPKQFRKLTHSGTVKKQVPNLNVHILTEHAIKLDSMLRLPIKSTKWEHARKDIEMLKESIDCYIDYLKQKANENNNCGDRDMDTKLKTIKGNKF